MSESSKQFNHDAHLSNVIAPEAPTASGGTPLPEAGKEKKIPLKFKIIGAGVVAVLAAGAAIGVNVANGAKAPEKAPVGTSEPANPAETPAPKPVAETITVASLEIPATLSPEQVGTAVIDSLSGWMMSGTNDKVYEEWLGFSEENKTTVEVTTDFVNQKAEQLGSIRAEALYGPYQNDTKIAPLIAGFKQNNAGYLENYLITHDDGSVFKYSMTTDSTNVVAQSSDSLTLTIIGTEHNNAAENRIGTQYDPGEIAIDGNRFEIPVTLTIVDGTYKVSQINITNLGK